MITRVRQALRSAAQNCGGSFEAAPEGVSQDALLDLLTDIATRLQTELGSSGTHGESRLSVPGVSIKVTTVAETRIERGLDALFKNRITFV